MLLLKLGKILLALETSYFLNSLGSVLIHCKSRHASYVVLGHKFSQLFDIDVDLYRNPLSACLFLFLFDQRPDYFAGSTPVGIEVDQVGSLEGFD